METTALANYPIALVTGASSGIGRAIAKELAARGYALILVARNQAALQELAEQLPTPAQVLCADLSDAAECRRVYEATHALGVEVLVNNAGIGRVGEFSTTALSADLAAIDLNIRAVQILTKLFLRDFEAAGRGRILNVASAAGYAAGPMLATYYATKSYVLRLGQAIAAELRIARSAVTLSTLCPGPVDTDFNRNAGVGKTAHAAKPERIAKAAVRGMLRGKTVILPGFRTKCGVLFAKLLPQRWMDRFLYRFQMRKLEAARTVATESTSGAACETDAKGENQAP